MKNAIFIQREAIKTITMLASSGKKHNIEALERIEKQKANVLSTDHPPVRFNHRRGIKHNYVIRGSIEVICK